MLALLARMSTWIKSQRGSNGVRESKSVEFTSNLVVRLHMPFNHSSMRVVFGWMELTRRVKRVITEVRHASVTNSVHPRLVGFFDTVIDPTVVTLY